MFPDDRKRMGNRKIERGEREDKKYNSDKDSKVRQRTERSTAAGPADQSCMSNENEEVMMIRKGRTRPRLARVPSRPIGDFKSGEQLVKFRLFVLR